MRCRRMPAVRSRRGGALAMLRFLAGGVLRVVGLAAMATFMLLQFAMPLLVGGGALRMGGLRGGIASRVAAPRVPLGRCSFSASTAVVLADGTTKPIADVRIGDRVLAEDPVTGDRGVRSVTHVWSHEDVLVDLETSDGSVVSTTQDHPFWNVTDRQWQPAIALDPGDRLLTGTGMTLTVDGLDLTTADSGVAYNLTVADLHTYYVGVGAHTALVHNTCFSRLGIKASRHFWQRLAGDKIQDTHALKAYLTGDLYFDPQMKSYIRHHAESGITVVATAPSGGTLKSVWKGKRKDHWQPIREQSVAPQKASRPTSGKGKGKGKRGRG
jgi:hypothetical protein